MKRNLEQVDLYHVKDRALKVNKQMRSGWSGETTAAIDGFCIAKRAVLIGPAVHAANFASFHSQRTRIRDDALILFEYHVNVSLPRKKRFSLFRYPVIESCIHTNKKSREFGLADNFRDQPRRESSKLIPS